MRDLLLDSDNFSQTNKIEKHLFYFWHIFHLIFPYRPFTETFQFENHFFFKLKKGRSCFFILVSNIFATFFTKLCISTCEKCTFLGIASEIYSSGTIIEVFSMVGIGVCFERIVQDCHHFQSISRTHSRQDAIVRLLWDQPLF